MHTNAEDKLLIVDHVFYLPFTLQYLNRHQVNPKLNLQMFNERQSYYVSKFYLFTNWFTSELS